MDSSRRRALEAAGWALPAASSQVSQRVSPGDAEQTGDPFRAGPLTCGLGAPKSQGHTTAASGLSRCPSYLLRGSSRSEISEADGPVTHILFFWGPPPFQEEQGDQSVRIRPGGFVGPQGRGGPSGHRNRPWSCSLQGFLGRAVRCHFQGDDPPEHPSPVHPTLPTDGPRPSVEKGFQSLFSPFPRVVSVLRPGHRHACSSLS